jgi:outer membrane immunogenic protein
MKKFLLACVACSAFCATPALAADKAAPAPAVWNWTGFYLGGSVGGVWSKDGATTVDTNPIDTTHNYSQGANGVFGGGQFGYNWQFSNLVLGVEGDLGDLAFTTKVARSNIVNGIPFQTSFDGGFAADATGRLGYAIGPALIYAKGGYAFLAGGANVIAVNPAFPIPTSEAHNFSGWTLGGGVEYALDTAWSVKLEYQYFDFGTRSSLTTINSECCGFSHDVTADTVKVGVNWKLGQ